jgi:hypothetical protein
MLHHCLIDLVGVEWWGPSGFYRIGPSPTRAGASLTRPSITPARPSMCLPRAAHDGEEQASHLRLQRAEARVIAQIAAVAVRPCDPDRAAGHDTQLCQIERSAKGPLIGVGHLTPLTARALPATPLV